MLYSPAGRSVLGETVPEVLSATRGCMNYIDVQAITFVTVIFDY